MATVNELKRLVENGDEPDELITDPDETLLEVFCVDTSISMARSQNFPYIFGESKLNLCKRIITQGFVLPEHCALFTALIKFNASPELAVPFALHSDDQVRTNESQSNAFPAMKRWLTHCKCITPDRGYQELSLPHGAPKGILHLYKLCLLRKNHLRVSTGAPSSRVRSKKAFSELQRLT